MTAHWSGGAISLWRQKSRIALAERLESIGIEPGKIGVPRKSALVALAIVSFSVLALAILRSHGLRNDRADQVVEPITPPAPTTAPPQLNAAAPSAMPSHTRRNPLLRPYPVQYDVLLTRSIFAVGGKAEPPSAISAGMSSSGGASSLSLMGISQEDAQFTAYVFDALGGKTLALHVGDSLGDGRICEITLHGLTYRSGTTLTSVEVGQGLASDAEGPK